MLDRHHAAPPTMLALLLCFLLLLACTSARAGQAGDGLALAYASYPELAAAVRQRMDGKAVSTAPAGALARELTAGRTDPRMRALALADWVRTHIRRADARLRLDGATPRPAAAVLAQRAGNVEEMVVLLRALLTEQGIASTAALVRDGADYALPDAAMLTAFDHMLVYLPGLELFLDPAADDIAAGYLPPSLLGKPVLLAGGGFAMTPMTQPQSVSTAATVDIRRDGSGAVRLERTYTGALAEPIRKSLRDGAPSGQAQFLPRVLLPVSGVPGSKAADAGVDTFRIALSGVSAHVLDLPGARGLATIHPYVGTIADAMAGMPWESAGGGDAACQAIDAADETRYRLPRQLRILALPPPVSVTRGGVFYRASYERQGNAVLVKRRLSFRNGRPTCTAAEVRAMRPALERIARDLRSQVRIAVR
jgi:hypothetical protein